MQTRENQPSPPNHTPDSLPLYAQDDKTDRRNRRIALVVAVIFHIALLAVQLPNRTAEAAEPEKRQVITVLTAVQYEPPPPPKPQEIRQPKAVRIPLPDPTPDDPEPIRQEHQIEPDLVIATDPTFVFPTEPPPARSNEPVRAGGDVLLPVRTHYVAPNYTEIARRARVEGTVVIDATIDKEGNVIDAKILRGLAMGLDQSALAAVKAWKFEPGTLDGRPVAVYYTVTATFTLN
jgi:periplasmic protein TonB